MVLIPVLAQLEMHMCNIAGDQAFGIILYIIPRMCAPSWVHTVISLPYPNYILNHYFKDYKQKQRPFSQGNEGVCEISYIGS